MSVTDSDSHNDIIHSQRHAQWKNCRHKLYKMRNRRILTAQCIAISQYMNLNRCTCARFCCRVEVGSLISAFRFPLCVSIVNLKNTTPSGDIQRALSTTLSIQVMGPKLYCAWPGIEHNKGQRTTPSGDIPREHYRQHCQYRVGGLRYIARGLASSIIKRNMHISNRWRHILNASTARNYRKKYI